MKTYLPTVVWALLTAGALLVPGEEVETLGGWPDWVAPVAHFLLFGILAWLLARALRAARRRWPPLAAFALAFAWGALLEAAQIPVPGRGFEWQDLAMNALGGLAGVLAAASRVSARR